MAKNHFARTDGAFYVDHSYHYAEPTGNILYVGSTQSGATTTNAGRTPENAYSTLASALGGLAADNNDVILLCPGHVETITGAAGVSLTTSHNGASIIGLGRGRQRARINFTTATAASFDIAASRVFISGLYFTGIGVDALTALVNVSGADVTIHDCEFELASASAQAVLGILATAAASRLRILDCDFHGTSDAGTTNAIQYGATDEVRIQRCRFHGAYATGSGAIQNTAAATGSYIADCDIQNLTGTCTKAMIFHASTTGQITRCNMQILSGTAPITGAAMSWVGQNYYAAAVATAPSSV